jgi:acetyl esterase/lipase
VSDSAPEARILLSEPLPPMNRLILLLIALVASAAAGIAADAPNFTRQEDVIYGRKYGMALTLDILRPKEHANGLGIIFVVSGGWYSNHPGDGGASRTGELLARGYTVFSVCHGSQP